MTILDTLEEQLHLERQIIGDIRYTRDRHPQDFSDLEIGELFCPYPSDPIVYVKISDRYALQIDGTTERFVFNNTEAVYGVAAADL